MSGTVLEPGRNPGTAGPASNAVTMNPSSRSAAGPKSFPSPRTLRFYGRRRDDLARTARPDAHLFGSRRAARIIPDPARTAPGLFAGRILEYLELYDQTQRSKQLCMADASSKGAHPRSSNPEGRYRHLDRRAQSAASARSKTAWQTRRAKTRWPRRTKPWRLNKTATLC